MALDIRTLVFILGLTRVIQFAVFIHQYRVNRTLRGVRWWLLWSGVEVLAFTCMLLRGVPALQPMAIFAQNGLLIWGVMFFYIGILNDGRIVNVNDGFLALSGLKREECIGKTTLAFMHGRTQPTGRLSPASCGKRGAAEVMRRFFSGKMAANCLG
jgi:PAS domain-containing protein